MASINNPLGGHVFSIDYLIEKAAEIAVNKTLIKVDEFVDTAIKKVERAVEKAYDQAFAKFSQQVNEAQPSAQKLDEVVDKAVKRSYDQAFAKFSEQATEAQYPTKNVDELVQKAFDEAFVKFSGRLSELAPSPRTQQNQRGAVNMEWAETAGHAAIETRQGSEQEPMEIEEVEILSVAKTEEESEDEVSPEDSPEDSFDKTCEHPRPGSIYAIHMDNSRRSVLAADENTDLKIWGYLNAEIGKNETQNCHWKCINGPDASLCFQNMKTRKYLGVDPQ